MIFSHILQKMLKVYFSNIYKDAHIMKYSYILYKSFMVWKKEFLYFIRDNHSMKNRIFIYLKASIIKNIECI
jgi:hypothetical protein